MEEDIKAKLKEAGDKLVVIDFFATWCFPCKTLKTKFEEFSKEYSNVIFCAVDIDELEVSDEYTITALPTVIFFKNGKEEKKIVGLNVDQLRQGIETLM